MIANPCANCKRTSCPKICYPKKDYQKALLKSYRKTKKEENKKAALS